MAIIDQRTTLPTLVSFSALQIGQVYETVAGALFRKISTTEAITLDSAWTVVTPGLADLCRPRTSILVIQD